MWEGITLDDAHRMEIEHFFALTFHNVSGTVTLFRNRRKWVIFYLRWITPSDVTEGNKITIYHYTPDDDAARMADCDSYNPLVNI